VNRSWSASLLALIVAGVCVTAALAVAGCSSGGGSSDDGASQDTTLLESTDWQATEIAGQAALTGADAPDVTAVFAAGKISGSGGVNRYSATFEAAADGTMTISQPAATLMTGPPAAMKQEQAYFAALEKAAGFSVTTDSLTLTDDQGARLVRYEASQPTSLRGTTWEARAYNNGKQALVSLEASSSITAVFGEDGRLTGDASVNRYTTGYTTSGETMSIDAAIATTRMAGPEELMRQEAAYLAALPQTATYSIEGDDLWLRDADGAALAQYVAAPD
jgi:heat shock protein HslJ